MGGDGGRDHDGRHARQLPQLPAGEVVGTHPVGAGGDNLGAPVVRPDVGGRPVGPLVAVGAPQLGAGLGAQRHEIRLLLAVHDQMDAAVVEHRRRRRAPPVAGLRRRQLARPAHGPVEAERIEADVAEQHVHVLPIGDRGLRGVGVLEMVRGRRHAGVHLGPPALRARLEVERVDQPVVDVPRGAALAVAVPPALGRFDVAVARDGGDEHEAAGHDRRAPPEAGYRGAPGDVVGGAPPFGQIRIVGDDAGGARAAELGPLLPAGRGRSGQTERGQQRTRHPRGDAAVNQGSCNHRQNHVVTFSCA